MTASCIRNFFIVIGLFNLSVTLHAQSEPSLSVHDAVDPTFIRSRVTLDVISFIYHQPARFYRAGFGYYYGLRNQRHQFGLEVPFVHSVFGEDLQGFENTVGIGDIRMFYMAAFPSEHTTGLVRVAPSLELSAPTGEYILGRGAGAWLFKPGVLFSFVPHPNVSFYPEVAFQFSGKEVNTRGGSSGIPDLEDPDKNEPLSNFTLRMPAILKLESAQAWFGISALYMNSFSEKTYFLFFDTEAGIMMGDKSSAMLRLTKFVGGLPRINIVAEAKFQFYF